MTEHSVQKPFLNYVGQGASYLIKIAMARLEYLAPIELTLATGKLLRILASTADGFDKQDLLRLFYPDFEEASATRKRSLEACMNKLIQRTRNRYLKFGVDIHFCRANRRWVLVPASEQRLAAGKVFPPRDNYQAL